MPAEALLGAVKKKVQDTCSRPARVTDSCGRQSAGVPGDGRRDNLRKLAGRGFVAFRGEDQIPAIACSKEYVTQAMGCR